MTRKEPQEALRMPDPPDEGNGAPRWVKISAIVAVVVVALFLVVLLVGRGEHGPGRHAPGGASEPARDTPGRHTGPPPGVQHGDE